MVEAHRRLRANFPDLLTLIAPRHPERGDGVAEIARAAGLAARLRSRGELPDAATEIYVADTVGELGLIYRLAPIVFIGGSLVRHGGQNPIEPAKLGAAILHGPHVGEFRRDLRRARRRAWRRAGRRRDQAHRGPRRHDGAAGRARRRRRRRATAR